jgi:DNA-binding transcriptional MerR regulator
MSSDKPSLEHKWPDAEAGPSYRSGVAARLAGLSVETLRVWERRYGVCDTERSPRGQRLYSAQQVNRLRLLKSLVDQGHPIGLIAGLSWEQLHDLSANTNAEDKPEGPIRVAVVGPTLSRQLAAGGRDGLDFDVRLSSAKLEQALPHLPGLECEVLLVEMSELDETALPLIEQARDAMNAKAAVVLYRFSPSATIRQLRMKNCTVARLTFDPAEIAALCRTALAGQRAVLKETSNTPVAAPRFDEGALTTLATASNKLGCECPRHLAEILLTLGSFERYSAQCASRNPEDAQLHQELGRSAGQARGILEQAMERLARAEGLQC